tara:strand:- start:2201 stop:2941 length:741 start_codon:yes stop_codon:yes gene_type:complete
LSSNTPSSSKGGMSNKTAQSSAVVQGIKADQYAQKKLGITAPNVMNTPAGTLVTKGFTSSTSSNQMYGSEYASARNEYLASQGLGTMQTNGSFTTGVQTDKGLTFTSAARDAYNASRREPIPLSKEMFESQQKFKTIAGALATGLSGMPSFFSAAYYSSKQPYSQYVADYYSGSKRGVGTGQNNVSTNKTEAPITNTNQMTENMTQASAGNQTAKNRLANLAKSDSGSPNRKFLQSSAQTFLGKMK